MSIHTADKDSLALPLQQSAVPGEEAERKDSEFETLLGSVKNNLFLPTSPLNVLSIERLLLNPTISSWVEVAFLVENKDMQNALDEFNVAARHSIAVCGSVQGVLNSKTTPDVSDSSQIVPFITAKLAKKKKVNCLGSALAALLIANANGVPCKILCSENHSWIELEDGTVVDVNDNLKAAKKSAKPLSIYSNAREMDWFSLCMILIVNKNQLSDEEEFYILHKFQHMLSHSWEFSKLFILGNKLFRTGSIPEGLLTKDPKSLGLISDRILHLINEEEDPVGALHDMNVLLERVAQLCLGYNVDTDWWLSPKGSFLNICEEFTTEFKDLSELESSYEQWVDQVAELARTSVPKAVDKFSKSAPRLSGKRRRVDKLL